MRFRLLLTIVSALGALSIATAAQTQPGTAPKPPAQTLPGALPGAQQTPPARSGAITPLAPQQPAAPNPASVPATAPVLTLEGFCPASGTAAKPPSGCKTEITRADFDRMVDALLTGQPTPQARASLADAYAKILVMSREAQKNGIGNDAEAQEAMRFQQLQTLAQLMLRRITKQSQEVPAADLEQYYKQHLGEYEEAALRRIYLPKNPPPDAKKLSNAELAALAEALQKRAVAGEDFDKLQSEAYAQLGMKTPPPPTRMGGQRRASLPQTQQETVFNLQAGQVSAVISDNLAFYIYKMESRHTLPLEGVRAEILRLLQQQRFQRALIEIFGNINVNLNPDYFGPNAKVELPKPAAAQAEQPLTIQGQREQRPARPPQ